MRRHQTRMRACCANASLCLCAHLVELPGLVPHDLHVLAVVVHRAGHLVDAAHDAVHVRVREAAGEVAPALRSGPDAHAA